MAVRSSTGAGTRGEDVQPASNALAKANKTKERE